MDFDAVDVSWPRTYIFPPIVVVLVVGLVTRNKGTHTFLPLSAPSLGIATIRSRSRIRSNPAVVYIAASTVSRTTGVHVRRNRDLCVLIVNVHAYTYTPMYTDARGCKSWVSKEGTRLLTLSTHLATYLNG